MRLAAKRDANHVSILAAFRQAGCSVLDLSRVGGGCPDALVARNGHSLLVEIKDGTKAPSKRKLRGNQEDFSARWRGRICVASSLDDVLLILNTIITKGIP